jgi:hypothetical protein
MKNMMNNKQYFGYQQQFGLENFSRENGQPPPESGPNFLVQGHPQTTSLSEGGQFWDWAEGVRMHQHHFGSQASQELPCDVKDFIASRQKQSWSDDERAYKAKPEKPSKEPASFPDFCNKDQKVSIKQESTVYPFDESNQEQDQTEKPKTEVKKERMDVAAYLDQQKAAERNRRWSPTPPPVPQPPPEDYKTSISSKEYQEHMERLKNNIKAEVPECNCFPPDKCKLF